MADVTISLDSIDLAQQRLIQAKGIAQLAGRMDTRDIPGDALRNAMWGLVGMLDEAFEALNARAPMPE